MEQVAKTEYYELAYDPTTNWIYWTMRGHWRSMKVVPNYFSDWKLAVQKAKPGFRVYADLSDLKVLPDDVKRAQDDQQRLLMAQGCKKVSVLMESSITQMTFDRATKSSGGDSMMRVFSKREADQAKIWLSE